MLLGQNFRGGHQRRLPPVFHAEVHAGGGHHGLAGAHVALAQPVHGHPGAHICQCLLHAPPLGVRQGEGQGIIKRLHVHIVAGRHVDGLPPGAQPLQADGEQEQLLKGQPPPGQVQRLRAFGEVDVLVGVFDAAEVVLPPHAVGQHIREDVRAGVQPLPDGAGQNELADPRRQGIDGHDAACELPPSLRLHNGGGHGFAEEVPLGLAVEDVRLALHQIVFQPRLVEEGHVQHAGVVHGPDFDEVHPLADVGNGRGRRDHGRHAGTLTGDQLGDLLRLGAVVIPPGEPGDQAPEVGNAQLFQGLRPLFADALDGSHIGVQVCHNVSPLPQDETIIINLEHFEKSLRRKGKLRASVDIKRRPPEPAGAGIKSLC